jgi:transcription elongation factor Elf1
MGAGRRSGSRAKVRARRTPSQRTPLNCPKCARAFLIGPDFVADVIATGRTWPGGRAELRCGICGHRWWSRHPEALRKARIILRASGPKAG